MGLYDAVEGAVVAGLYEETLQGEGGDVVVEVLALVVAPQSANLA